MPLPVLYKLSIFKILVFSRASGASKIFSTENRDPDSSPTPLGRLTLLSKGIDEKNACVLIPTILIPHYISS
jgi:hypothetical protein